MLTLKSGHLIFEESLVSEVFGNEEYINYVYYPEKATLLIAAKSLTFFSKLHKTSWTNLKWKNANGAKSMFLRDIILDYELDDTDRILNFEINKNRIIAIKIK